MRSLNKHPGWENMPIRLTDEERQNLYGVLDDFFSCFHLQDIREMMWEWLVAALSTESGAYSSGFARSNLIFVYEKLEAMIEAAHGLHRKRKKSLMRKRNFKAYR
jgi:hypothetical protein